MICELEFECCQRTTVVMFDVGPLAGRGKNRKACSACWRALTARQAPPKPATAPKVSDALPSIRMRQRPLM